MSKTSRATRPILPFRREPVSRSERSRDGGLPFPILLLAALLPLASACSIEPGDETAAGGDRVSLQPPGTSSFARAIDRSSVDVRVVVSIDGGEAREVNASPRGAPEGPWSATFAVPRGSSYSLEIVWSAVDVDDNRIEYARLSRSFPAVSDDEFQDLSRDGYDLSAASYDDDGDGVSNFEELVAGTPAIGAPEAVRPTLDLMPIKTFRFGWTDVAGATLYRVLENPDGVSGFVQIGADVPAGVERFDHVVPLYARVNASYVVQACTASACTDSEVLSVPDDLTDAIGFVKASDPGAFDEFGGDVALSADGTTLAVGAFRAGGGSSGVNGAQSNAAADDASGAVYVFVRDDGAWSQQAYLEASNAGALDRFGSSLSLSADGDVLAIGADGEGSEARGVGGDEADNSLLNAGAVYVFAREGRSWSQRAYVKAGDTAEMDVFGIAVSLNADGDVLAIGANGKDSAATGANGDQDDDSAPSVGAVYIFTRDGRSWSQQAYLRASNAGAFDDFGRSLDLNDVGDVLAVGAYREDSGATGVDGDQDDNSVSRGGAVYVFERDGPDWTQTAYVKASNTGTPDAFGLALALSGGGDVLAVGAASEASAARGVDGDQSDDSAEGAGAVYVFVREGGSWSQQAYLKAGNTGASDRFGSGIDLSADGDVLAVTAPSEDGSAAGVGGDESDDSADGAGAAYIFTRDGRSWVQRAYLKADRPNAGDRFGGGLDLSADGNTLAVGAVGESTAASGVGGSREGGTVQTAGAVYLF